MLGANSHHSDVARLLTQITLEYEAAQRGMTDLSCGSSQHAFITAKMEKMNEIHTQLHDLVGDRAIALIVEQLGACPDLSQ